MEIPWTSVLKGKVVLLGIGNILRGDDGFGPYLMARLEGRVGAICIDAGTAPENYLGRISRENPDTVLLADAVHLDLSPGHYALLKKEDIVRSGLTTHTLSPHLFMECLQSRTTATIYLLGVQPQTTAFCEELSEPMQKAITQLAADIQEALHA
ncbi:MAG: hydrogenase 3 maturation endopeptidase HyCI [Elusimicrobiota bacterium]|jgi:hydrogenase 3 maturation protease